MLSRAIVPATIITACAGLAQAQPIDSAFTYQGELRDSGLLADGLYDINFALFASETGGIAIAAELIEDVQVENGLFTTEIDFGASAFTQGEKRWMLIQVSPANAGSFSSLSPRQEINATPFATFATEAMDAQNADFATASGTTLQQAYNNGQTIDLTGFNFDGDISIGSQVDNAAIRILETDTDQALRIIGAEPLIGAPTWSMSMERINNGNRLDIDDNLDGSTGMLFQGYGGEDRLLLSGASSFFEFDSDDTIPDDRVRMPNDSVNAVEMSSEPGVASIINGTTTLTQDLATVDTISSRTIITPDDGYVLVIASFEVQISKGTIGTNITANFGVSDTNTALPSNQDVEIFIDGDLPAGSYDQPVTVHGLFSVSEGANTFYLLGDQNSTDGTFGAIDTQLTCIYFPTSYGAVSPTERPAPGITDFDTAGAAPLNAAQLNAERNASISENNARIAGELAQMKARIAELEAELAGNDRDR